MTEILYLDEPQNTEELLQSLCGPVRLWFKEKFPDFTRPQKLAIPSIMSGEHLLLCSPTGSGKTLTAFLTIIDRLIRLAMDNKLEDRVYCTYISPIKALANDIQKNLIGPLSEIEDRYLPDRSQSVRVGLRTGDTSQLGGPIKIAKITGQVAKYGVVAFLSIMAYISISLGFINLFPIPMLDGGHLMFYAFEKILGRPLTQKTQEGFFRIGLFLLLSLMFFTTFNDLRDLGLF